MISKRRLLICPLVLLVATLAALPAAALELSPLARPVPAQVWDTDYLDRQAGLFEAEIKSRMVDKAMQADPGATAGMDDYDVIAYDLVMDVDHVLQMVSGTTTIEARVVAADLVTMDLHLSPALAVGAVRSGGLPAGFSRSGDVLTVVLDRLYALDEMVSVEVDYSGDPATGANGAFGWATAEGAPMVWTLSEPYGARDWWVCKDLTTDKADAVDIHVTVDDPMYVVSNGNLVDQVPAGPGRTTFHWEERYPIATYLVSLAIHPYLILTDSYEPTAGGPMPVIHYVVPNYQVDAEVGYAVTIQMIENFAAAFGEYPFLDEKYGHAHFPWGGGMEHQTCSSMLWWYYGEYLIAHELAHQWFGDLITCATFNHIWLNEGFARWMEAYWAESAYGVQAYRDKMNSVRYLGPGTVYVEDTVNDNIFSGDLSYNKASWVVHMLRFVMGEQDFFDGLLEYRNQFGHGAATTEDLQAVMEGISGLDLTAFFQQWIYGEYFPQYVLNWSPVTSGDQITVRVVQNQLNVGLFVMPLEIRVTTNLETVTHRVQNSLAQEWYTFPINGTVQDVELDPDGWILCLKTDGGVSGLPVPVAATRITGNTPNPFNPQTEIAYNLADDANVRLEIFDLAGRRVRTLVSSHQSAGNRRAVWDGSGDDGRQVAGGLYFARLRADGVESLHKLSLVK